MGCRGSKMEAEDEAKLRPILRTRVKEELMARKHGGLSKKQLLAADANIHVHRELLVEQVDANAITLPSLSLAMPTFQQTQDSPPTLQIIHNNSSSTQLLDDHDHDDDEQNVEANKEMEYIHDLGSGSPSFRVYCIQSISVDDELHEIAEQLHSKEFVEDKKDYLRQKSSNSNEVVLEKEVIKKHKRGIKKLRMITIPKAAGRNIMRSLYHFPCNSNSNNSQLVQQAAA